MRMLSSRPRGRIEIWGLVLFFALFLVLATVLNKAGQSAVPNTAPSSLNAKPLGAKALYMLLEQVGYRVDRLEAPWGTLGREDGLLVAIEPFDKDRPFSPAENATLTKWVRDGGSLLLITQQPQDAQPDDPLGGDMTIVSSGSNVRLTAGPAVSDTPWTKNIKRISIQTQVRLHPLPGTGYQTLFQDDEGAFVVQKSIGKGHLIVAANDLFTSNDGLKNTVQDDNALFVVNVAAATVGTTGHTVLFDEYHHGVGFETAVDRGEQWYQAAPLPLVLGLYHLGAFGLLLVYNGNRRFGLARPLTHAVYRPSTEYVGSMAKLYKRAHAGDIAVQTLYGKFLRDLTRKLDLPPDAPTGQILQYAERTFGANAAPLPALLGRCEQIVAGGERVSDAEMVNLVREIETVRRRLDLVGN